MHRVEVSSFMNLADAFGVNSLSGLVKLTSNSPNFGLKIFEFIK